MSPLTLTQTTAAPTTNQVPLTAEVRRQLKVRLLRDLISNGLYRVDTRALADRLLPVVHGAAEAR